MLADAAYPFLSFSFRSLFQKVGREEYEVKLGCRQRAGDREDIYRRTVGRASDPPHFSGADLLASYRWPPCQTAIGLATEGIVHGR